MQASKARNGSSETPQKTSPRTPKRSPSTKRNGSESDSATTKLTPGRSSTERSPKVTDRRSPKKPVSEKKRPVRLSELECQITQLQEELAKTKDQLCTSESSKQQAQLEANEANNELKVMEAKLEESQCQLVGFPTAEDASLQEPRKISQEPGKAWQSELEVLQKQHSDDCTALGSATNEIQRLKQQLDAVVKSETAQMEDSQTAKTELEALKDVMEATLFTVESLRFQISEKEKAEEEAKLIMSETREELKMANATIETLRSKGCTLQESLNSTTSKLEESRIRVSALEEMLIELQPSTEDDEAGRKPSDEVVSFPSQYELEQLKAALEAAEAKLQVEQIKTTMQIQSAHEMAEHVKVVAGLRGAELESTLQKTKTQLEELKARFLSMELEIQSVSQSNKELKGEIEKEIANHFDSELKLMKVTTDVTELKAKLLDKETELQSILEENELLKSEHSKKECEHQENYAAAIADAESARGGEQEALTRLGVVNEEAEKNSIKAAKALEQLDAAQAVKSEMQAELRRLRVQSDQWRKVAEVAAAALTPEDNGRIVERTTSLDSDYNSLAGKLVRSPLSDSVYDESPKKKHGSMLRKFGLWKKGQK